MGGLLALQTKKCQEFDDILRVTGRNATAIEVFFHEHRKSFRSRIHVCGIDFSRLCGTVSCALAFCCLWRLSRRRSSRRSADARSLAAAVADHPVDSQAAY